MATIYRMRPWPLLLLLACSSEPAFVDDEPAPCDTDEDGDGWVSAECGGEDCCDIDPGTRPDAWLGDDGWQHANRPSFCGSWDRNCDGWVEHWRPSRLATCNPSLPPATSFEACTLDDEPDEWGWPSGGWLDVHPGCGGEGAWVLSCKWDGVDTCEPQGDPLIVEQRCR
jgi:hypothetical protein